MKGERWETMVEATEFYSDELRVCRSADVLKLLARQHRAVVEMVRKRMITDVEGDWDKGHNMAITDLLAALTKQGGKS